MTKKSINSGSRKWFIVAMMSFTILTGLIMPSCQKRYEANEAYFESRSNRLGFCVGDSIQYQTSNTYKLNVFGFIMACFNDAGCFMSHCASKPPVSLSTISTIDAVLDEYSKEKAMNDSLWIWSSLDLFDPGSRFTHYEEYVCMYSFPAFPLVGLAFKVSVKDIVKPETVSIPSDCVLLEESTRSSLNLLPEKYRPQTETENRITVNHFLVDFTTMDLDSLRFEGKFSMDWTIDCGEEQVRLSTNSGYFYYSMKNTKRL